MGTITNANPAVVTVPNTYPDGTNLILTGCTDMTQISGMTFTISSSTAADFTLLGLDASGFSTPGTDVVIEKEVSKGTLPRFRYITKITRGQPTTVVFSTTHNYIAQQVLKFTIPSSFGMTEMDQANLVVKSVVDDYTITVDIDSTQFTEFAFPPSTLAAPPLVVTYTTPLVATVCPAGSRNSYNFNQIPFRQNL